MMKMKKFGAILAFSGFLVPFNTVIAMEDLNTEKIKAANAMGSMGAGLINECREDFRRSGKTAVQYFEEISNSRPEFGVPFLLITTYNNRPATAEEASSIEKALKNIAQYLAKPGNDKQTLSVWEGVEKACDSAKHYFTRLEDRIATLETLNRDLQKQVDANNASISSLEARLTQAEEERKRADARFEKANEERKAAEDRRTEELSAVRQEFFTALRESEERAKEREANLLQFMRDQFKERDSQTAETVRSIMGYVDKAHQEAKETLKASNQMLEGLIEKEKAARQADIERIEAAAREREANLLKIIEQNKAEAKAREEEWIKRFDQQQAEAKVRQADFLRTLSEERESARRDIFQIRTEASGNQRHLIDSLYLACDDDCDHSYPYGFVNHQYSQPVAVA